MLWWVLLIVAVLVFLSCGNPDRPTAIGGGATLGVVIGLGLAIYQPGFEWWTIGKGFIIGTLAGLAAEGLALLPRLWSR